MADIRRYEDKTALMQAAAAHVIAVGQEAVAAAGQFSLALSGGSTPKALYELLAADAYAASLDWAKVHVFWGDERMVPPDHAGSNYRMAREAWLARAPIPAENVHRIAGELEPQPAAAQYEETLRGFFAGAPRFDLVLLGMGDDGHTASLFPGTAAIHERERWVAAHYVEKLAAWRVTLTPPVINAAANVTFLVAGAGKAERLREVLRGPFQPEALPSQIIQPEGGKLLWLVDAAAAAQLAE